MRISDWSSDVCSSDLPTQTQMNQALHPSQLGQIHQQLPNHTTSQNKPTRCMGKQFPLHARVHSNRFGWSPPNSDSIECSTKSDEHPSELQSLMRISYAALCLKKKTYAQYNTYKKP